jgi:serine/threonine protein phosphatase PrpC
MKITQATAQGPRPYQEDRKVVYQDQDGTLLAVFDGHGGDTAAVLASTSLVDSYLTRKHCENKTRMLTGIFEDMDFVTAASESGTTASVVYINPDQDKAYVAVLGDSPVLILRQDGVLVPSPDHNIRTNPIEESRAVARGATVFNGYIWNTTSRWNDYPQGLQMSRALGDVKLRPILSQKPETYSIGLDGNSYILVATDGLFDPAHKDVGATKRIHGFIQSHNCTASELVDYALTQLDNDNVTVILARMNETADVLFAFGDNIAYLATESSSLVAA